MNMILAVAVAAAKRAASEANILPAVEMDPFYYTISILTMVLMTFASFIVCLTLPTILLRVSQILDVLRGPPPILAPRPHEPGR